jgi:gliding motility-associated protein GldM
MSIPKAPTPIWNPFIAVLLATFLFLNLSAEMLNAHMFPSMDKVFTRSNILLDASVQQSQDDFEKYFYYMNDYDVFNEKMEKTRRIINGFMNFMDTMRTGLEQAEKHLHDKDMPQKYFFSGKTPRATQIKTKIVETHQQLLNVLESFYEVIRGHGGKPELEMELLRKWLLLNMDEKEWKTAPNQTWETATFANLPVSGCLAMLSKLKSNARADEIKIIQYLTTKVTYCGGAFDKFEPASVPKKQFVVEGEPFQTEIFLTDHLSRFRGNVSYVADSVALPVKRGKGIFEAQTREVGVKSYTIHFTYQNPFTQQLDSGSKTFQYEVIQPSIRCAADQMNVLYIGVPQPISIHAAGIPSDLVQVTCTGCALKPNGAGKFMATATQQGIAQIHVTAKSGHQSFPFRVKLPPNPVPTLNQQRSGQMTVAQMRAQSRILLETNDLDVKYAVQSFVLMRVPHSDRAHPMATVVKSDFLDAAALRLVAAAQVGDWYCFYNIKANAPADSNSRDIGSMNFQICNDE